MKKLLIALAFAGLTTASFAQEDATVKNSVATNSFWSNWFVQAGGQWTAFYSSAEHGFDTSNSPLKSFRTNPQASVAIGKWFTPGLGLRTKVSGIWGKANGDSFKYWNAQEQVLFNLSNMICGYNPDRVWNVIPFAGGGFARNCNYNTYAMGLSVGLLNEFQVSKKVAINFELGWNRLENDFYSENSANNGPRGWDSHDNYLYAEIGLTLNLGKTGWNAIPDVDAIKAGYQSNIDALNGKLRDAQAENARLQKLLSQPKPEPVKEVISESVKEFITTPVSVFFNLSKTNVANPKDLVNVRALAKYAIDNNKNLLVTGYADSSTGTPAINQKLSENRAKTVKEELIKMGVAESKISTAHNGGVKLLGVDLPIDFDRRATVQVVE